MARRPQQGPTPLATPLTRRGATALAAVLLGATAACAAPGPWSADGRSERPASAPSAAGGAAPDGLHPRRGRWRPAARRGRPTGPRPRRRLRLPPRARRCPAGRLRRGPGDLPAGDGVRDGRGTGRRRARPLGRHVPARAREEPRGHRLRRLFHGLRPRLGGRRRRRRTHAGRTGQRRHRTHRHRPYRRRGTRARVAESRRCQGRPAGLHLRPGRRPAPRGTALGGRADRRGADRRRRPGRPEGGRGRRPRSACTGAPHGRPPPTNGNWRSPARSPPRRPRAARTST